MHAIASKPLMLIFPFGYLSHYVRCLQLAHYFSHHYELLFADHTLYNQYVSSAGFGSFTCLSIDARKTLPLVQRFDFSWLNETTLEAVFKDQVRVINEMKPAVILADATPTLRMAADATNVPMISLMNGYMTKYYAVVRKLSQTHPLYKFLRYLPDNVLEKATAKGEAIAFAQVHKPFKDLRKKYSLSATTNYFDEAEGSYNLICDHINYFPQKKLPENYWSVGPVFMDSSDIGQTIPELDKTQKSIFVSMGSTGDWEKVSFLNNPYFRKYNIITSGDKYNILHNDHIAQLPFAHSKDLFSSIDLVICHGGNGSIYQALSYGIPVLCKTNHFEQEWNVAAFGKAGVAASLDGITQLQDYIAIIEEWIDKKGKALHTSCSNNIQQDLQKPEYAINEIITLLENEEHQENK